MGDNTSSHAAGAAAPSTSPTSFTDNDVSVEADTAGTPVLVDNDVSQQHTDAVATTDASHADHITEASSEGPAPSSQAGSQGTASGSRPSFLLMLQSKMEQRRQQRRESQSASDSSLSSVHEAGVSSAEKAEGSITSGAQNEKLRCHVALLASLQHHTNSVDGVTCLQKRVAMLLLCCDVSYVLQGHCVMRASGTSRDP